MSCNVILRMFPYHSYWSLLINDWWLNESRVVIFLVCCKCWIDFLLIVVDWVVMQQSSCFFLCLIDQTTCRSAALRQAARNNHTTSKLIKNRSPRRHTAMLLGERKYYHPCGATQIDSQQGRVCMPPSLARSSGAPSRIGTIIRLVAAWTHITALIMHHNNTTQMSS